MMKAPTKLFMNRAGAEGHGALELICPADSPAALRAAVDHGADWIWFDCSRYGARHSENLGFEEIALRKGVRYAHDRHCRVALTLPDDDSQDDWRARVRLVDCAAASGIDALTLSDPALMLYAAARHPGVELQCPMSEAALNRGSVNVLRRQFGMRRLVLPRVLSLSALYRLSSPPDVELVLSGSAKLVLPADRRAMASAVMDEFTASSVELCGNSEAAVNDSCYRQEPAPACEPLRLLPQLAALGIGAIVAEAREQAPIQVAQVTRVWREAIDDCLEDRGRYSVRPIWLKNLAKSAKDPG